MLANRLPSSSPFATSWPAVVAPRRPRPAYAALPLRRAVLHHLQALRLSTTLLLLFATDVILAAPQQVNQAAVV